VGHFSDDVKGVGLVGSWKVRRALFVFGLSGLVSVLVDLDHAVAMAWYPYLNEGRIFHTPILVIACVITGCCCSYLGGLYLRLVLRRQRWP